MVLSETIFSIKIRGRINKIPLKKDDFKEVKAMKNEHRLVQFRRKEKKIMAIFVIGN